MGAWLASAALLAVVTAHAEAGDAPRLLRISTENSAQHVQTRVLQRFADRLAAATAGRLRIEFHHSAEYFRDRDVLRAMAENRVEMAVPGTWQLDRLDPYVSVLMMPAFFGRDADEHHRIRDGHIGRSISRHLENSLDVKVLGRWIDLGYAHLYFIAHPPVRHQDLANLRMRIPGGEANAARLAAIGARPMVVSWPDLPQLLAQGRIDGLLSTHETIASAQLWRYGLRHAVETREYFAQYVPLVAGAYWRSLAPDLQQAILEAWDSIVDEARDEAAQAQRLARATLAHNGVRIHIPSPAAMAAWRAALALKEPALATQLGTPSALIEDARRVLGDAL